MEKKGLSAVITTLITILLVLVAVGIVWVVVNNIIESGAGQVDVQSKCLVVDIKPTNVDCANPAACSISINRKAGGEDIAGVKLVFSNDTDSGSVVDVPGNIAVLETITSTVDSGLSNPNKMDAVAYFIDDAGQENICSKTASYSF